MSASSALANAPAHESRQLWQLTLDKPIFGRNLKFLLDEQGPGEGTLAEKCASVIGEGHVVQNKLRQPNCRYCALRVSCGENRGITDCKFRQCLEMASYTWFHFCHPLLIINRLEDHACTASVLDSSAYCLLFFFFFFFFLGRKTLEKIAIEHS